jgi:hypothetical protein
MTQATQASGYTPRPRPADEQLKLRKALERLERLTHELYLVHDLEPEVPDLAELMDLTWPTTTAP